MRKRFLPKGWYPDSEPGCRKDIEGFKSYIQELTKDFGEVRGGIVPHAGWYFSGRLAALVMHLAAADNHPDIVIVYGGHLGSGPGVIYDDDSWETPLGPIEIDRDFTRMLTERTRLRPEGTYTNDNTVEIQIPLVKYYFPESGLVALRAPHSTEAIELGEKTVEVARELGRSILVLGSTDLTHYGPNYGFEPRGIGPKAVEWVKNENDKEFIDRTLSHDQAGLLEHAARNSSACSAGAVAAASSAAQLMGSEKGKMVDYYTSYDVMPGNSFVGYAGILF